MAKVASIYSDAPWVQRTLVAARPVICPPEPIIATVPSGASVLDVGCGVGAMLVTLAMQHKLGTGVGCDVNPAAIRLARKAAARMPGADLEFFVGGCPAVISPRRFDVVMLIDVMHHVKPPVQKRLFRDCVRRLNVNGFMVYKDMGERPLWKNLFNRFHDAIVSRQIINYVPLQIVKHWGREFGCRLEQEVVYGKLAYQHELLVLKKISDY